MLCVASWCYAWRCYRGMVIGNKLRLDLGGCAVVFALRSHEHKRIGYDLSFEFFRLQAALPVRRNCLMTSSDIDRLVKFLRGTLSENRRPGSSFAAYDSFFVIEDLGDDVVRVSVDYGLVESLCIEVQASATREAIEDFCRQWECVIG